MLIFKRLLDFYIQSSLHVGLALFCMVYVTVFENGVCSHITYPCCVLFGTILGYNFLKYFEIFRKGKFHSLKYYVIVVVCVFALVGYFFFYIRMVNSIKVQLALGGLMVVGYLPLRRYGVLKMFFVAFVVAYLTSYVFIDSLPLYRGNSFFEMFKRFVIVSALMVPFEIYDSQHDDKTLNTLPQKYGIKVAKRLGLLLLLLFAGLSVLSFHFNPNFNSMHWVIELVIALFTGGAIYFSSLERNMYYSKFWVESIPVLWFALLLVFS